MWRLERLPNLHYRQSVSTWRALDLGCVKPFGWQVQRIVLANSKLALSGEVRLVIHLS